ncbi:MAG: hypothetical protein KBT47_00370, partial [Armatimonadetes bacterium]|nr:hypothetical protein [Candidatus Hippobium faecium]
NYEKNNLCFAVRNTDINPDNIKIKVSAPKNALFYNMKTFEKIKTDYSEGMHTFDLYLLGRETGVIKAVNPNSINKFKIGMAKRQLENLSELIDPDALWAQEEDSVKLRKIIGEKFTETLKDKDLKDFCETGLKKIEGITGRNREEAEYILRNTLNYLNM